MPLSTILRVRRLTIRIRNADLSLLRYDLNVLNLLSPCRSNRLFRNLRRIPRILITNHLRNSVHSLVCKALVLEDCIESAWHPWELMRYLLNANSSSVRPAVSGKKNQTKQISNASQQQ